MTTTKAQRQTMLLDMLNEVVSDIIAMVSRGDVVAARMLLDHVNDRLSRWHIATNQPAASGVFLYVEELDDAETLDAVRRMFR